MRQENCIGNVNKEITIALMRENITEPFRLLNEFTKGED